MWWGATGNHLRGPFILPQHISFIRLFTPNVCTMNCQPSSRWHPYEHDVIYSTSMTDKTSYHSNRQSVSRWQRCAGWPPPSPDHTPFIDHVLTYMKPMAHASEVNTGQKLHRILSTARYLNNAIVLCKFTRSMGRGVKKMYPHRSNFEPLAWIANYVRCALNLSR